MIKVLPSSNPENEDNLVEVNNRFKQVPKTLRYSWQEYMLNRDRQPSEYINSVTCIDQPTRSSSYKNISNTVMFILILPKLCVRLDYISKKPLCQRV